MGLLQGPTGVRCLMTEVPLQGVGVWVWTRSWRTSPFKSDLSGLEKSEGLAW